MQRRFSKILFFTVFVVLTIFRVPTASANTGFLGGPMWISPEVPQDGELVSLSALFHNAEPNSLSGDVLFYDSNVLLGKKSITIPSGGVSTATVSFRISAGDHSFSATAGNLSESLSDGKTEPFVLSPQTVQLPNISVSPKAGNSLNASVVSGTTNLVTNNIFPQNPMANVASKVNELQGNVISSIPDSVANPVTNTATALDSWRTNNANSFANQTKAASISIDKTKELASTEQKKFGKASFSTNFVDKPFAYVKLFVFELLSFIWSHAIIFYGLLVLILYAILRFVYKKITGSKKSEYPSKNKKK